MPYINENSQRGEEHIVQSIHGQRVSTPLANTDKCGKCKDSTQHRLVYEHLYDLGGREECIRFASPEVDSPA